jgi:accessory colonization factor AcfC
MVVSAGLATTAEPLHSCAGQRQNLRTSINAFQDRCPYAYDKIEEGSDAAEWIEWASQQGDWFEPLV